MTRVAIVQSNYVPWRGYFDLIDDADVFVLFDDVQYTDRDWRNRNRIRTAEGLEWITVSVRPHRRDTIIQDIEVDWDTPWARRHLDLLSENYRAAPFYRGIAEAFEAILSLRPARLSTLNRLLIEWACEKLGVTTRLIDAASLAGRGRKTERLISLVEALGGDAYLSGPSAKAYLDEDAFRRAGIALEYKAYDYAPYPQQGEGFEGAVSILDLLMNVGPAARAYLKSR